MHEYSTYILRCSDSSFYVGVTNDIETRVRQHEEGTDESCYTFKRRPLELVHVEYFNDIRDAIAREKQLKNWSRKKKEALIQGNESLLEHHAKKKEWHRKAIPVLGVDVIIRDDTERILLVQRKDDETWSMPGGWVENGETPDQAVVREVLEETGLEVSLEAVFDVCIRPNKTVHLTYGAHVVGGTVCTSEETIAIRYVHPQEIQQWHADHKARIERCLQKFSTR